jgi:hypothetical protein
MLEYFQYDRAHRVSRHIDLLLDAEKSRLVREASEYAAAERASRTESRQEKPKRFSLAAARQLLARYARLATT